MASFDEHIDQAKKNLKLLSQLNKSISDTWDWQVTIAYYAAVHLMNAHLAATKNFHFRTHKDVKVHIYSGNGCAVPSDIYTKYVKLEGLSRRARYLCHDNNGGNPGSAYFTYDRHLRKALTSLDEILLFFQSAYQIQFPAETINCIEISGLPLKHFSHAS